MKKQFKTQSEVTCNIAMMLTEGEARALVAMQCYGIDAFLKTFYGGLGKSYLEPHEAALRELFQAISDELPTHLYQVDEARKSLTKPTTP